MLLLFRDSHFLTDVLRQPRFCRLLAATCLIPVSLVAEEVPQGRFDEQVKPFLEEHCVSCHGPKKSKGKVTLHTLEGINGHADLEQWETILEVLESGEMPPEDEPQPTAEARAAVVKWIEAGLRTQADTPTEEKPQTMVRRLTNFEYQNTMRDLFGFELKLIDNLPEDPLKPYRFNNTADFMLIGPEQLDRYRENAERMLASAIVDPAKPQIHRTFREFSAKAPPESGMQSDEVGVYGNRRDSPGAGVGLTSWPSTGEFRVRIKAAAILPPGVSEVPLRLVMGYGLNENSSTLRAEPVGTVVLRNRVDEPQMFEFRGRIENFPARPPVGQKTGLTKPTMAITAQNLYDNGMLNEFTTFFGDWAVAFPRAVVQSIEFEAPIADVWPPAHHTRILFDSPLRQSDTKAYVREVLQRFLPRAFRRPVENGEVEHFVKLYELVAPEFDTFEAAMRETLTMVLISPQFLYHTVIPQGGGAQVQYELASRLSYFLWGSMPDEELMRLAAEGKLSDPAQIETQVLRLLADARSAQFVDNFSSQWLSSKKVKGVSINRDLFPRFLYLVAFGERKGEEVPYVPTVRDYMHQETSAFIAELIRRNASVKNLVDSDFAMLNQRLAAHYGVEGVEGHELRPVPIKPEHHLGGLLTQGSVLVGNSTGSAPHPIYRAVWLREAILGDEVAPPPAEVPALTDTAGAEAANATTIAEMLRKHRQVESCNDCHVRLDPWGIPFEHYNSIGQFQPKVPANGTRLRLYAPGKDKNFAEYEEYLKSVNKVEVLASAKLPKGPEVGGMTDLKVYLLREKLDPIAENVIRRLLTYSLGRELTYQDRFVVEQLRNEAKVDGYLMRDLIVAVCQSKPFLTPSHTSHKQ